MPGSRSHSAPPMSSLTARRPASGCTAMDAAIETAARRHSVGVLDSVTPARTSLASASSVATSSPRAVATWRHTRGSRSDSSRSHACRTTSPRRSRAGCSSPSAARRVAPAAARSRSRAAWRRAGREPIDGAATHSRAFSRRAASASARGSTATDASAPSSRHRPRRARIACPDSAFLPPIAMRVATAAKVAAVPSCTRCRARRPRSRRSSHAGSAAASSYRARAAAGADSQSRSSTRPSARATRTLCRSLSGLRPSSRPGPGSVAARATVASVCRKLARRASGSVRAPSSRSPWRS